jgi:hypothetical protein
MLPEGNSPFQELPRNAGMRVAVRRSLRRGELTGTPLEDLGVRPDVERRLTERDLLEGNKDLIETAGNLLSEMDHYHLSGRVIQHDAGSLKITVNSLGIDWIEVLDKKRLLKSVDAVDGVQVVDVVIPPGWLGTLEIRGYAGDKLVARHAVKTST